MQLAALSNVLATPHIAAGFEALQAQAVEAVKTVAEILAGRMPRSALNWEHAYRLRHLPAPTPRS